MTFGKTVSKMITLARSNTLKRGNNAQTELASSL